MTGWANVLKVEQYDPCCEGARTSIVSMVDAIMTRWPPRPDTIEMKDLPNEAQDLIKEIEEHMKDFREFLLEMDCDDIREIIQRKGQVRVFNVDGDIAIFWNENMDILNAALHQCDEAEDYEDKLEFNTDLFQGREDWT